MSEATALRLAADSNVDNVSQVRNVSTADTQDNPDWGWTGINIQHVDFGGRASSGWDFVTAFDGNGPVRRDASATAAAWSTSRISASGTCATSPP